MTHKAGPPKILGTSSLVIMKTTRSGPGNGNGYSLGSLPMPSGEVQSESVGRLGSNYITVIDGLLNGSEVHSMKVRTGKWWALNCNSK